MRYCNCCQYFRQLEYSVVEINNDVIPCSPIKNTKKTPLTCEMSYRISWHLIQIVFILRRGPWEERQVRLPTRRSWIGKRKWFCKLVAGGNTFRYNLHVQVPLEWFADSKYSRTKASTPKCCSSLLYLPTPDGPTRQIHLLLTIKNNIRPRCIIIIPSFCNRLLLTEGIKFFPQESCSAL